MHYKTVKDVVSYSSELHHQISHVYQQMSQAQSQSASQERVKLLLGHLHTHELHLEKSLDQFVNDHSQTVLDSWLQYVPEHDLSELLDKIDVKRDLSPDEVIEVALKLDDYFIGLYEDMVEHASSASVKSVFQNLLEMEQQERIHIAKTALSLNDI